MSEFRVKDGIISQEMGSERVVFDKNTNKIHSLNPSAKLVFDAIAANKTEKETEQELVSTLAIDVNQSVAAYDEAVALLLESGLIEQPNASADWNRRDFIGTAVKMAAVPVLMSATVKSAVASTSACACDNVTDSSNCPSGSTICRSIDNGGGNIETNVACYIPSPPAAATACECTTQNVCDVLVANAMAEVCEVCPVEPVANC